MSEPTTIYDYYFRLEEQILEDHFLRLLDRHIDFKAQQRGIWRAILGRDALHPGSC